MKSKTILCYHCKNLIKTKDELAVVGNSFVTYHNDCFDSIKHSSVYAFNAGYKINGYFPWVMLVILNFALWSTYYFYHSPLEEVIIMSLFISSVSIFYRLMAYLLYERYYD